jgi:hypothetical protein
MASTLCLFESKAEFQAASGKPGIQKPPFVPAGYPWQFKINKIGPLPPDSLPDTQDES